MKYCHRPFHYMHLDPGGGCRVCAWTDIKVGNLLESSMEEIWHSPEAEAVRESIRNQSFEYCRSTSCPCLENNSLEEVTEEEFERRAALPEAPEEFNVAFDFTCNHSCPSCRNAIYQTDEEYRSRLESLIEKVLPYLNRAKAFSTNGNGDVFSNPRMLQMLSDLRPERDDFTLYIETNGVLFDEAHWQKIAHLKDYRFVVAVTPNSFDRETYRYLCGGHDNLDKLLKNLHFIRGLREKEIVNEFQISIVVQDRNFRELPSFSRRCIEEFHADSVIVKPLYKWFCLDEDAYWFKDVLNPLHPYHKDYLKMMEDPILEDPHVYLWGARNLHPAVKHPAYKYKKMLEVQTRMMREELFGKTLAQRLTDEGYTNVILYGDNDLAELMIRMLKKENFSIDFCLARDTERTGIEGTPMKRLGEYEPSEEDIIVVSNFMDISFVKRDLDVKGFRGKLVGVDRLYGE